MRIDLGALAVALGRRPWSALATAWLVCLLGWSLLVWPTVARPPSFAPPRSDAVDGALPPPPAVVRLRADLVRARALGVEVRARLAAIPTTLVTAAGPRANPLLERLRTFQRSQDHLIDALQRRLAATGGATVAPPSWRPAIALIRPALPLLILAIGAGLGLAVVGWRARRDGVIAGVAQLERAVALPVLGQIATMKASTARAWTCRRVGAQLGLVGLLAAWALVTVVTGSGPAGVPAG